MTLATERFSKGIATRTEVKVCRQGPVRIKGDVQPGLKLSTWCSGAQHGARLGVRDWTTWQQLIRLQILHLQQIQVLHVRHLDRGCAEGQKSQFALDDRRSMVRALFRHVVGRLLH